MRKILMIAFMAVALIANAAVEKTLTGHAVYYGSGKETRDQCKAEALNAARFEALQREYGSIITQDVTSIGTLSEGKETNYFQSLNNAELKGEWLGDIGEPKFSITLDESDNLVVECTVKFKAREVSNEAVDFYAEVLRNGMTDRDRSNTFRDRDQMYLSFKAPVNGYLAVYLAAEDGFVYPLFPYRSNLDGLVKLKGNTEYILFNEHDRTFGQADPFVLITDDDVEVNQLYVIFSPSQFSKAVDRKYEGVVLNRLTFNEFNNWVLKSRSRDPKMGMKRISLMITKN